MKALQFLFFCVLFSTTVATAQYGNNYGYGNRYNSMSNIPQKDSKPTPAEIEKSREERVTTAMEKLKGELNLDELQYIAIKNDISSSFKNMEIVMKSENSDEDKQKELIAIQEKTEKSIKSYLNPGQKEKYDKMKEDKAVGKKETKKKRKEKAETTEQ